MCETATQWKIPCIGLLAIAAVCVVVTASPGARSQTAAAPHGPDEAYVPTMTFDVASVRENRNIDPSAGFAVSGGFVPHTTKLRINNWQIENLISVAYGVDWYQIKGAPRWPLPTVFVIEAQGDAEEDARFAALTAAQQKAEQEHMLQKLLADRFQMSVHREAKEGDVYNLVVAKGGPKLGAEGSLKPAADEMKFFADRPLPALRQRNEGKGYAFRAHGCSMTEWAAMLTSQFGRPVIDRTGLSGRYDFVVAYKGRWDRDRPADDLDPMPPMDRALEEQLGLKVEPAKGPITMLVIDHIEKPSAN